MKIPDKFYSITEETFNNDLKWSHHSYLNQSVLNIAYHFSDEQQARIYNVNEQDITGKFNSINFLLHMYIYHSVNRFRSYPKNQDPTMDFILIGKDLIQHGALLDTKDWDRSTFLDNYNNLLIGSPYIYKSEKSFLNANFLDCLQNKDTEINYLDRTKDVNKFYLKTYLDKTLQEDLKNYKKVKI